MKAKVLYNSRTEIKTADLIISIHAKIKTLDKPKKMKIYSSKISFKDYNISNHRSVISNPIFKVFNSRHVINPINIEQLLSSRSFVTLKFDINKEKYNEYKPFIYNNINDLYNRVIKFYKIVKMQFINKYSLSYMQDTYHLNEKLFDIILTNIESTVTKYEDVTDKLIISEIIKYFRSNV